MVYNLSMNQLQPLGKIILLSGVILIVIGVILIFWDKIPFLGKLPGDIIVRKKNFTLYFPLATSIILSLILTLVLYLLRK